MRWPGWILAAALLSASAAADPGPTPPLAAPRAPVEAAPATPPPGGPSLLERYLSLEKRLRAADPATVVRYQIRLREAGYFSGPPDGRISRSMLRALGDCLQAGCALPN
jgi:hypothetical protein